MIDSEELHHLSWSFSRCPSSRNQVGVWNRCPEEAKLDVKRLKKYLPGEELDFRYREVRPVWKSAGHDSVVIRSQWTYLRMERKLANLHAQSSPPSLSTSLIHWRSRCERISLIQSIFCLLKVMPLPAQSYVDFHNYNCLATHSDSLRLSISSKSALMAEEIQ